MLSQDVQPSVWYYVKTSNHTIKLISPSASHTILVFFTKCYGIIPMGVLNAGGV